VGLLCKKAFESVCCDCADEFSLVFRKSSVAARPIMSGTIARIVQVVKVVRPLADSRLAGAGACHHEEMS
jgi:hypothetical protein